MDVLIVEHDELVGAMLMDTLDEEGISAAIASDEEALALSPDSAPKVVITGINRGHTEDMVGLMVVRAMRRKLPQLCAVYLASLWPVRLRRDMLASRERFLTKPVCLARLTHTVRELLHAGRRRDGAVTGRA